MALFFEVLIAALAAFFLHICLTALFSRLLAEYSAAERAEEERRKEERPDPAPQCGGGSVETDGKRAARAGGGKENSGSRGEKDGKDDPAGKESAK